MNWESVAYDSGVLDPAVHDRLVKDLGSYAEDAGVPPEMIWTSMKEYCDSEEIEWVKGYQRVRYSLQPGFAYVGKMYPAVDLRMMAMAGAFVRNFVNARVMSLQNVLTHTRTGGIAASVLLIPNFYTGKSGGTLPAWQVGLIGDLLVHRASHQLVTVVCVDSWKGLQADYGAVIYRHVKERFYALS